MFPFLNISKTIIGILLSLQSAIAVLSITAISSLDSPAIALCKDNNIPIMVFDIFKKGNISKAVAGEPIGSLIS